MGQDQSIPQPHSARSYNTQGYQTTVVDKVQHQGVLKLRSTPFPNCVEIDSGGMTLFIENAQTTLQDLLQARFYTNRLFPYEDIKKLIENVVYTLAHFQYLSVPYRDLCSYNIYYCSGQFKLLPNQLISETIFDRVWHSNLQRQDFVCLSPEMIIALRYKQREIDDEQILHKSNVFILGILLLEACTMLPSCECFDQKTYDIFNKIITQRLELVEDHYDSKITRIIANMIDYDYSERMMMKDIAIWINRQFCGEEQQQPKDYVSCQSSEYQSKPKSSGIKSRVIESEQQKYEPEEIHQSQNYEYNNRAFPRKNNVYMNNYNDLKEVQKSEHIPKNGPKNSVYLQYHHNCAVEQKTNDLYRKEVETPERKIGNNYRNQNVYLEPARNMQLIKNMELGSHHERKKQIQPQQHKYHGHYEYQGKYEASNQQTDRYYKHEQTKFKQITNLKPQKRKMQNPYCNPVSYQKKSQIPDQTPKNKYYPSVSELQNRNILSETRRMALHSQVGLKKHTQYIKQDSNHETFNSRESDSKYSIKDGSINRIKQQIQKSKKLIQNFRKTEGIANI